MKRQIALFLVLAFVLTALLPLCFSAATFAPKAATEGATIDALGGYENLRLTYTFKYSASDRARQTSEKLLPYAGYYDENGTLKDFFFDSYLFLPCMDYGPSGARMHYDVNNPTKAIDWTTYVEDTFVSGYNVDALESAFNTVKKGLGDTETQAGVFLTILYPAKGATSFGTLGGRSLDFSKTDDRKYAIKWMIDEQVKLFNNKNYKHLDLVGFYWLEEAIMDDGDAELFNYASEYLHSLGYKFIWIPWFKSNGYDRHEELGIDVACMQPNLFWMSEPDYNRVKTSCSISKQYGMGMEMEVSYDVEQDEYFNRYLCYLEGGLQSGMMREVKMYYDDFSVYYYACNSSVQNMRDTYDLTYKYAKQTLTQADLDVYDETGGTVNDIYFDKTLEKADWISVGKSYTGCRSYYDGNGFDYQNISGNELTDGIIASEVLSTDWFAFHHSVVDENGEMSITVDLGEVRDDIKHFAAHFDNRQEYGIASPATVTVSTSVDGKSFTAYAQPALTYDATDSAFYVCGKAVTARYVKLTVTRDTAPFVFCSEFLIGVDKTDSGEPEPEPELEVTLPDAIEQQGSPYGDLSIMVDGYTGLGKITGYENRQDRMIAFKNTTAKSQTYSFTVTYPEKRLVDTVTLYMLDYSAGCVVLPRSLTFTINGTDYVPTITSNPNNITKAELLLDKSVNTDTVTVKVTTTTQSGYYNMFSELTSVEETPDPHECVGEGDWITDENNHYKLCECGEECEKAPHDEGEWVETTPAQVGVAGEETLKCTVCGYALDTRATDPLPDTHVCVGEGDWQSDDDGHYKLCACGEECEREAHNSGTWEITVPPQIGVAGELSLKCTVCGHTLMTQGVDPLPNPDPDPDPDPDPEFELGDINGDNKIDSADYILLKRICFNSFTLDDVMFKYADIDGNGDLDTTDYLLLKRICFGSYIL